MNTLTLSISQCPYWKNTDSELRSANVILSRLTFFVTLCLWKVHFQIQTGQLP